MTGYLSREYAQSFIEWGVPEPLPEAGGWLVKRAIPGSRLYDAMGPYPLFCCRNWARLAADLGVLAERLVAVSLVIDPFAGVEPAAFEDAFDFVRPWKSHFVTDLSKPAGAIVRGKHRRNVARAERRVTVEVCGDPMRFLEDWLILYGELCRRHGISGLRAFSRAAFTAQLRVPGLVMLRATAGGETVGLHLWYLQGDVAYAHLGATNALGYALMASYALFSGAIEHFRTRARWLELGAGPGLSPSAEGGLAWFKRGFATGTRPTYFCGRILDRAAYAELATAAGHHGPYFPAYRGGRFD